jgi:hypothetical protein
VSKAKADFIAKKLEIPYEHDLLVPFYWKNRGLCPSCAGRRIAAQATLVDRVLPAVPIRQAVARGAFPADASGSCMA